MLAYYDREWEGLASRIVGRWCPSFSGATGLQLPDTMGRNHGVLNNMDRNTAWVTSGGAGAMNFNGVNNFLRVSGSFEFLRNNDKTIMGWVRTSAPGSSFRTVFSRDKTFAITVLNSVFITYDWVTSSVISSGVNVASGNWRQICVSIRSGVSNGSQLFVDGSPAGSLFTYANQTGNPTVDASMMTGLNSDNSPASEHVNGQLDDVIVFNAALTASEVRFLYEQGRGGGMLLQPPRRRSFLVSAGFKAYWARRRSQIIGAGNVSS